MLIQGVVNDLLCQDGFGYAHFPELVDLAVIGTGLGLPRSSMEFVKNVPAFWDSTNWEVAPRPFLDSQSLAYANALAAWIRGDRDPSWARELPGTVKSPMKRSLKYLFQTGDSFIQASPSALQSSLELSQAEWTGLVESKLASTQIVALRHLKFDESRPGQHDSFLVERLRSGNREIVLHSIDATQRMKSVSEPVAAGLGLLLEHRDDEIRAKALHSLTRSGRLDEQAISAAAKMLESRTRHEVFAGAVALASLDSVPGHVLASADRGIFRALQKCDFEFVGLYASAFNRWLDDPREHFRKLLAADSPEYLGIALDALRNVRGQLVPLALSGNRANDQTVPDPEISGSRRESG